MLRLAGELADGTALGAAGPRCIETVAVPRSAEAARAAGRPAPRVAALFPIAVTGDRDGARVAAREMYPGYERLPSYRVLLEREGLKDMGGLAISGDEEQGPPATATTRRDRCDRLCGIPHRTGGRHRRIRPDLPPPRPMYGLAGIARGQLEVHPPAEGEDHRRQRSHGPSLTRSRPVTAPPIG